jgi:hypothetical protein
VDACLEWGGLLLLVGCDQVLIHFTIVQQYLLQYCGVFAHLCYLLADSGAVYPAKMTAVLL